MHLIVGYDAHPASQAALGFAVWIGRDIGAKIHVVHVVDSDDLPVDPDSLDYDNELQAHLSTHRQVVAGMLGSHDDWEYAAHGGLPASVLMNMAQRLHPAMIVVGRPQHGIGAMLEHALSGSVSRSLLHRAACPVVIVPENSDYRGQ
ncbi:universal stress protein [Jongsikchunia kroppenstedtii]|uniref:universal stress protein n=1 Tax=Jongsikchunia kroppenstedtii TaxID=1121721 RepID=UPI000375D841|nr:universal stress protein [Jongsikchunia kroppenstedtii]